ncbi:polysaccharide deacetylase family protein [Bacillus sp. RAR_GA_16]|uniref:polysaccharide deacetylase family protein n=1 Tax=Bacillus sp. RAR_GA_16 TaxID=2876774 RepID=UPI001CCE8A71|nr:polysaccharide deacetylase family protein [Bacillus sp. RAR_GA_16]MCA0172222.1 polysaccharide deacetylase family protein [Bacillus sp. RAR_GA_16]
MKNFTLISLIILALLGSLVGFGFNVGENDGTTDAAENETNESNTDVESTSSAKKQDENLQSNETKQTQRDERLRMAAEKAPAREIPVLTYHHIIAKDDLKEKNFNKDGTLANTIVPLENFKKQMAFLHENGFYTLDLEEFQQFMEGQIEVPEKSVLITFDDGHKNNYINAYPVMKDYGFQAVEFLITSYNKDEAELQDVQNNHYLTHEEIDDASDVFEFASHTNSFHNSEEDGTAYLISKSFSEVERDIETSIDLIGQTNALAYPYGAYDEETMEAIHAAGIEMAFTVQAGYAQPGDDMLQIHRNTVRPYQSISEFKELLNLG